MDDDPAMNRIIQEVVGYLGYDVRLTPNAEDGLALAEKLEPQLILLSLRMAGTDSAKVCRRLRQSPATAETPVLFMSPQPASPDFRDEVAAGARYFTSKPFLANDLAADLYHLGQAGFHLPMSAQELLRVTRILPEPVELEAEAAPPAEELMQDNGGGRGNGKEHAPASAEESAEPESAPEETGRRHLRRFAQRQAQPGHDLEELLAEVRAIRQTSLANAYRIKALVAVLEEAGVIDRGAVDRSMQQVLREGRANGGS